MLQVKGVIVRRNCMGRKLSFADIRRVAADIDDETDNNDSNNNNEINNDHQADNGDIVKVAFRRHSSAWKDEESPTPFPIKTSDLPYGGLALLQLQPAVPENETSSSTANDGTEQRSSTTNSNSCGLYEVVSWQVLQDPKQAAEALASVGQDKRMGGMSYSTYLRARGNNFWTTTKGQRYAASLQEQQQQQQQPADNNTTHPAAKKRPRSGSPPETNKNNDDLQQQQGGHGDKVAKAMRARLFAQWLLETYGAASLQEGSGVLDVAGGKGSLSIELAVSGAAAAVESAGDGPYQIPCTVIDPMIRKQQQSFPVKRDAKRIRKAGGQLPRHLATFFNQNSFVEQFGSVMGIADDDRKIKEATTLNSDGDDNDNDRYLISNSSILVGLHPDQTTQDILDIALRYDKNVAIVPCCVFPSFFPLRQLKDGTSVVTHTQFCQFLLERDSSLRQAELSFQGRNIVIYRCKESQAGQTRDESEAIRPGKLPSRGDEMV